VCSELTVDSLIMLKINHVSNVTTNHVWNVALLIVIAVQNFEIVSRICCVCRNNNANLALALIGDKPIVGRAGDLMLDYCR